MFYAFSISLVTAEGTRPFEGIVDASRYSQACQLAWKAIRAECDRLGGRRVATTELCVEQVWQALQEVPSYAERYQRGETDE